MVLIDRLRVSSGRIAASGAPAVGENGRVKGLIELTTAVPKLPCIPVVMYTLQGNSVGFMSMHRPRTMFNIGFYLGTLANIRGHASSIIEAPPHDVINAFAAFHLQYKVQRWSCICSSAQKEKKLATFGFLDA